MRITWRTPIFMMLVIVWPQLGCQHLWPGRPADQVAPLPSTISAKAKLPEASVAEKAQALLNKADSLEKIGKNKDAVAIYEQVRQLGGDYTLHATRRLALLALRDLDDDRAEQELQALLQQNPKDADALCNLGIIHYRRGRFGIAEKCFDDAKFHQPDNQVAWLNLAQAQAQNDHYELSLETFMKFYSKADAYCNVAAIMTTQGKRDEAMRMYQQALQFDPKLNRARLELAKLETMPPLQYMSPSIVKVKLPPRNFNLPDIPANVELEEQHPSITKLAQGTGDNMSRLMIQRPILPPLPEVDLNAPGGREGETTLPSRRKQ